MNQANITRILHEVNNWQEFNARIKKFDTQTKGDCFEIITKYFLQLHPNYATKLEEVWYLREVPPRVRRHLNLPGPDEGIDLVARTKEGEYWAIQCKYREDESKSLTRKELSTFTDLSFNICTNITLSLVCTTADRFSYKLRLYGDKISFVCGDRWRELEPDFFRRLRSLIKGKTALPKSLKPRSHQQQAVRNAHKYFVTEGNTRGKMIMPCGTGKSLAAYWIADKLEARSILIAVPSLALIRQTLEVWARESLAKQKDIHWICVCSDETVSKFERDDLPVLTQDLGVKVHTDADEIAEWLRKRRPGITVVMTTYQSGKAISSAAKKAKRVFDIGIMDEAHKTVGKKDSLFSHLLHDQNIKIRRRVFMTATERRYAGRSEHIASMDDPNLYGNTFELLTFKEALDCEPPILSDYKVVTIMVTRDEVAELIERNLFVKPDRGKWDDEVEAEMLACAVALRKAIKKYRIKHSVSFHSSIARARAFKEIQDRFEGAFPAYGMLETFHVSGRTPTSVRSREIDEFEAARRSLITNARCLTEGVDVPNIDCVLFADPRRSIVDIVQAVGRALRPAEGKERGYVVVPVLLEDEISTDLLSQGGAFDTVLTTLRALAANDERIVEYFRGISQGRKAEWGDSPVDMDVPIGLRIDVDEFVDSIELRFWSSLAKLSWRPFEEARAFVHSLGLKGENEWRKYRRNEMSDKGSLPEDIPVNPDQVYRGKGWVNWGDWLGTGTIATRHREYRSFKEARAFAHSLKLKNQTEWRRYYKGELPVKGHIPDDVPSDPYKVYKGQGWESWGDWLGTGTIAPWLREFRPFEEARAFAHGLGLKSNIEWRKYCGGELPEKGILPADIPAAPDKTYRYKGWVNWGDWLGTGTISPHLREFRPFEEARAFVHSLGLKGENEWRKYCRNEMPDKGTLPKDIPTNPNKTYRYKDWVSWGDWLGKD